jgi:TonB family protein
VQRSLRRAITDYQGGHLSLEQLQRHIEDEIRTPDGRRAVQLLLEAADQSLPRSVRDLLVRFSTSPAAAPNLRASRAANSTASWPAGERERASTLVRGTPAPIGPGSVLGGRYRLIREIGRGGMGVVYLADGLVDLQPFAVKVLNPEFLQHPDAIRVLREEARKSLAMRHPNIVGVYPLEREGEQYYLPMEYLEGKTARELLDQDFARGVPVDQAWPIVKGAGAALAFAHDHGVIHSDLKPSNIFVTTGGRPRVLDFGIARALRDRRHFDTNSLGAMTEVYASCEMLTNRPPDFRDDVYGFACVVYELLTGNHPFAGQTAAEARTRRMVVPPIRALTPAQNALLRKGLAFNREDRVATIEEFLNVCGGVGTSAGGGDPRTAPRSEVTFPDDAALRFCAVCGKELPDVARFCPGCGASTEAEAPSAVNGELQIPGEYRRVGVGAGKGEPRPSRQRFALLGKWVIAVVASGIAAAVVIGLVALLAVRSSHSPPAKVNPGAPVPNASAMHTPASRPQDAARHEPTAEAVKASDATQGSAAVSTPAAPSPAPLVSNALPAFASPAPDAESPSPGLTGPPPPSPAAPQHPGARPRDEDIEHPPIGKHVSPFKLAPNSPTVDEACPYPAAAEKNGDTGIVVLLVYVAADGSATTADVESSSNSQVLDDAAVECVEQKLHFMPKRIAGVTIGSWARMTFKWSFGE